LINRRNTTQPSFFEGLKDVMKGIAREIMPIA
jgi:hypothetical protein